MSNTPLYTKNSIDKDVQYNEYFGFTDADVRNMLACYGFTDKYDIVNVFAKSGITSADCFPASRQPSQTLPRHPALSVLRTARSGMTGIGLEVLVFTAHGMW